MTADIHQTHPRPSLSILLVGTQMAVGGAQRVLLDQASWFRAHGHRVETAFFYDKLGLQAKWQASHGFPIHNLRAYSLEANPFHRFFMLAGGLFRYLVLLGRGRFDVVETFTPESNLLGLPLAWAVGVRARIATYHGAVREKFGLRERLHAAVINSGLTSACVAVSAGAKESAVRYGVRRDLIVTIPNGIRLEETSLEPHLDLRRELDLPKDAQLIICIGRLVEEKAHEILIQAMGLVCSDWPKAFLLIAGGGLLHDDLKRQVSGSGLENNVRLLGNREDVQRLLGSADIFVLSSRREGLPMALLEAMAAGLPVVSTRVGGIDEVVRDGVEGWLVPAGDAKALSEALLQALRHPEQRERMGQAARRRIEQGYTLDRMNEQYLNLMLEILGSGMNSSRAQV
jgi:glycosyltransferase involved in cell wall biosynthesis